MCKMIERMLRIFWVIFVLLYIKPVCEHSLSIFLSSCTFMQVWSLRTNHDWKVLFYCEKVLYWLSGLTCSDENFIIKSGAQRAASSEGIALIAPDTSPSKLGPLKSLSLCLQASWGLAYVSTFRCHQTVM